MGKLPHFSVENSCYFLTSTISERRPLFRNEKYAQILCNIIYNLRNKGKMSLLGFVIMPEHFHLLIVPSSGTKISWIMQEIKKGSARLINKDRVRRAQGRARLPDEKEALRDQGTLGRPGPIGNTGSRYSGSSLTPNNNPTWYSGSSLTPNNNPTWYSGSSLTPKKVWMDEYYDYVIRDEEDLIRHLQYTHNNPVKRGLVETTEKYIWSSANPNFENDLENTLSGSGTSPTTF
ncbi:hypothetical protein COZ60_04575 [Candidatus Bathyarchaeota archaeon CG_4_8_14_3_um_filter_42_8]|nr:MAG: hypothetical protein COZ60_04575 [Candidatus Bathyarchaeota archaeon CG_4_8_14_3_um_filter_42_8]